MLHKRNTGYLQSITDRAHSSHDNSSLFEGKAKFSATESLTPLMFQPQLQTGLVESNPSKDARTRFLFVFSSGPCESPGLVQISASYECLLYECNFRADHLVLDPFGELVPGEGCFCQSQHSLVACISFPWVGVP